MSSHATIIACNKRSDAVTLEALHRLITQVLEAVNQQHELQAAQNLEAMEYVPGLKTRQEHEAFAVRLQRSRDVFAIAMESLIGRCTTLTDRLHSRHKAESIHHELDELTYNLQVDTSLTTELVADVLKNAPLDTQEGQQEQGNVMQENLQDEQAPAPSAPIIQQPADDDDMEEGNVDDEDSLFAAVLHAGVFMSLADTDAPAAKAQNVPYLQA